MPRQNLVITAENLTRCFGRGDAQTTALHGASLTIPRGRWTTVVGPPGSGKTTLFDCLAGFALPDDGRITLHSPGHSRRRPIELNSLSDDARTRLRRTRIGALPAQPDLLGILTVRENILLAARLSHRRLDPGDCADLFETLGLQEHLNRLPHQVSVEHRQRIRLARVLLTGPDIILADEPTAVLQQDSGRRFLRLLAEAVADLPMTLVLFTGREELAELGHLTLQMRDGRLSERPAGRSAPAPPLPAPSAAATGATSPLPEPGEEQHHRVVPVVEEDQARC